MQNILAIIPARAGSKSIQDKNLHVVGGKPLLAHSIDHAAASALITRTIVSTDSETYGEIARSAGADVPFLRPAALAEDHSTDLDVFEHALMWLKENEGYIPDILVHLRPTYPIRNPADIDAMVRILQDDPVLDAVRSITPAPYTPYKMWFLEEGNILKAVVESGIRDAYNLPRQLLPNVYMQNACIDVVRASVITEKHSMTGDAVYGYLMDDHFDVDTKEDIRVVERQLLTESAKIAPVLHGRSRTFCFEIDGVITKTSDGENYARAKPMETMISVVQRLYDEGNRIILYTSRDCTAHKNLKEITERQLQDWGVPYHELHFGKPVADVYVDNRIVSFESLFPQSIPSNV